jgi:serine/threonine protein phosphatase PrpC
MSLSFSAQFKPNMTAQAVALPAIDKVASCALSTLAVADSCTTTKPTPDMRLADCGGSVLPGWQLGWAQVIGRRHPRFTEDSVAHASRLLAGRVLGSAQALYLAVGDGIGGGSRGEICSAALTSHCISLPEELLGHADSIARWMELAEGQVQMKLRQVSFSPGASTLASAWLQPAEAGACVANGFIMRVGDSRLYRFDGQHVTALTTDQTYASVGEMPPEGASPDDPARMIGTGFMGQPELLPIELSIGQTLLLCSDGLHRGLSEQHIAELLHEGGDLRTCALRLAQEARLAGSDDDITVLLAQFDPSDGNQGSSPVTALRNLFRQVFS